MAENKDILSWPSGRIDFTGGCRIMGILNVTPDSFSDGGEYLNFERAIEHSLEMAAQGAAIIDVGAESTRPGSEPVPASEQIARAIPVIKALRAKVSIPISIDTYSPEVASAAIDAGANILNDITALSSDDMARLAAKAEVPVILMHIQGTPKTMQAKPIYKDVAAEVKQFLIERADKAESFGIKRERIFIDPGIGFGKTLEHNLLLIKHLQEFVSTGYRVLLGTSRKGFIGKLTGRDNPAERLLGTAATVAIAAFCGCSIVRVHDVPQMADVLKVINAINQTTD
jgi:dihydropteroate synthase